MNPLGSLYIVYFLKMTNLLMMRFYRKVIPVVGASETISCRPKVFRQTWRGLRVTMVAVQLWLPRAFGLDLAIQAEQNRIYRHLGMAFNCSYAKCTLGSG